MATAIAGCSAPADAEASGDEEDLTSFGGKRVEGYDRTLPDVDAIGYAVTLSVDERASGGEGYTAEVKGTYTATRDLTSLDLDLEGNDIDRVLVNGRTATFRREGARLTISVAARAGQSFSTTVKYHGKLFQADGKDHNDFAGFGGLMVTHGGRAGQTIYSSLNWPQKARRWLPLRDHPRDGAMLTMTATFPARLTVVSNGKPISSADGPNGSRTWRFSALTPMPTYDFFLAAFDGWKEDVLTAPESRVEVHAHVYGRDVDAGKKIYADVPAVADFYARTFGPYRWGDRVQYLEIPMYAGGMENATVIGMDETLFPKTEAAEARQVAFHELAHHWSGNLVRFASWNDFWLSEGFTEYLTRRAIEDRDGLPAAQAVWRTTLASALSAEASQLHPVRPADPERDVLGFFDDVVYEKGAFVLRMLEQRLGREKVTAFLRGWFDRHAFGKAGTADLAKELSDAAGQDLAPFFAQWVYGEYHPEVRVTVARADATNVDVTVEQVQTRGPAGGFAMPLDIELGRGSDAKRVTVDVTKRKVTQRFPVSFDATRITVDPDEKGYLTVTCDTGSRCRDGYRCGGAVCLPQ
jgi:aminopeptidase N